MEDEQRTFIPVCFWCEDDHCDTTIGGRRAHFLMLSHIDLATAEWMLRDHLAGRHNQSVNGYYMPYGGLLDDTSVLWEEAP